MFVIPTSRAATMEESAFPSSITARHYISQPVRPTTLFGNPDNALFLFCCTASWCILLDSSSFPRGSSEGVCVPVRAPVFGRTEVLLFWR